MHLAAWRESINSATLIAIDAVVDDILNRPTAERFLVPNGMNYLHWVAVTGVDVTRAAVVTPSIGVRRMNLEVVPRVRGSVTFEEPNVNVMRFPRSFRLDPTEHIEVQAAEDNAAASVVVALAELGPEQLPAMPQGDIRAMRLTGTTTLVAATWTTVQPTEDTTLEPGNYSLVGFLPISANVIAARAIIPGQNYRPGMPGLAAAEAAAVDINPTTVQPLMYYDMGRFDHNNVPQFQFLSEVADTAETIIAYVVKV